MKKPIILVTNDDGISAKGINMLVDIVRPMGEIIVVAPDSPQSAQGHAITIKEPLRLRPSKQFEGIEAYECSGTPVDCVKLANNVVLKGRKADLCVSGINHGSNAAINIIYSGTMSAAMEASLEGIDSIGFSLLDFSHNADFEPGRKFITKIIQQVLEEGLNGCKLLNVNIPKLPEPEIKGIRVCRQADAHWDETFVEGQDPHGRPYYWLAGNFINEDKRSDTDIAALDEGYISVVPSMHDLTAYQAMPKMKDLLEG